MSNPRLVLLVALGFIMMLMWQEWQKDYGPRPKSPDSGVTSSPQGKTALPQRCRRRIGAARATGTHVRG